MCMTWNYQVVLSKKVLSTLCKLPSCLNSLKPSMSKRSKCTTQSSTVSTSISGAVNLFSPYRGNIWLEILMSRSASVQLMSSLPHVGSVWLHRDWLSAKRLGRIGFQISLFQNQTICSLPPWLTNLLPSFGIRSPRWSEQPIVWLPVGLQNGKAHLLDYFCSGLSLPTRMMADELQLSKRLWSSHPLWDYWIYL